MCLQRRHSELTPNIVESRYSTEYIQRITYVSHCLSALMLFYSAP